MQAPNPAVYLPKAKWRTRMGRVAANLHVKTRIASSGAEDLVNILLRSPLITAQGSRGLRSGRSLTMSMRGNKGGVAHSPGCAPWLFPDDVQDAVHSQRICHSVDQENFVFAKLFSPWGPK